ncbi:MAG: VPDSG-CTERM exosortase interaction domain protein [Mediterranea massiliensis]|nr:VPDSG-CTERM exosortase interaction domain protein [Mediterranea massiliensis]
MNKKSFFLGVVTGIVLTFAGLIVIGYVNQNEYDPIQYLEQPVSYENKTETSFQVFQVLSNAALAREASDVIGGDVMYLGNIVVILGENFYNDQVVTIDNPQRLGSYSYTTNAGRPMTVPVVDGNMK